MVIYLASSWSNRSVMPVRALEFIRAGHTIAEEWWYHPDAMTDRATLREEAHADLAAIQRSSALVLLHYGLSDGKATELGYAMALGKPCLVVFLAGNRTDNVFYYSDQVVLFHSVRQAVAFLETLESQKVQTTPQAEQTDERYVRRLLSETHREDKKCLRGTPGCVIHDVVADGFACRDLIGRVITY